MAYYASSPTPYQWVELDGDPSATVVIGYGHTWANPIDIGSNTIRFFGSTYTGPTALYASANGTITFGSGFTGTGPGDLITLPGQACIAPLWQDYYQNQGGPNMLLAKIDTANNRLIIEWNQVFLLPAGSSPWSFEVIIQLNSGNTPGNITILYKQLGSSKAATASIGVKDVGNPASNYTIVSIAQSSPLVDNGKAILFWPSSMQHRMPQPLGWMPRSPAPHTLLQLDNYNTWVAFAFSVDQPRTLTSFKIWCSALTGVIGASGITASLYADNGAGLPAAGPPLEWHASPDVPTANAYLNFYSFNTALTPGTIYWLVIKTVASAPVANYIKILFNPADTQAAYAAGAKWAQAYTTTGDNGWVSYTRNALGIARWGFADGTWGGWPIPLSVGFSPNLVYGTTESGVKFSVPANIWANVAGISMYLPSSFVGNPNGGIRFGLRVANAPPVYTFSTPGPAVTTQLEGVSGVWHTAYFGTPQLITPGQVIRATLADLPGNADTASNAYRMIEYDFESDANGLAMLPFGGTLQKTFSADGYSSWVDTPTAIFPFALLLDTNGEYAPASSVSGAPGAGGLLTYQGLTGGMAG